MYENIKGLVSFNIINKVIIEVNFKKNMVWRIKEKDNLGACIGNNKDTGNLIVV